MLGVFRGSGASASVRAFEVAHHTTVAYVLDFIGQRSEKAADHWGTIDRPGYACRAWHSSRKRLVLSVPMTPTSGETIREGAAGHYDRHWATFGRALVAAGCPDTVLRLGWEFNRARSPWSAVDREAEFAAYWRHIVRVLRRTPGAHFRFDWSILAGVADAHVEAAWPGDDVVDFVGIDAYDVSEADAPLRWDDIVHQDYGLQWQADFATKHRKSMTIPEWGLWLGNASSAGGDDATYIRNMADWIGSHQVTYAIYFDVRADDGDHRLDRAPHASEAFDTVARALTATR